MSPTYSTAPHPYLAGAFAVVISNRYGTRPVADSCGSARVFRTAADASAFVAARAA